MSLDVANSTVSDYAGRARAAGLSWPLPEGMDDAALEAALFPPAPPSRLPRPESDWNPGVAGGREGVRRLRGPEVRGRRRTRRRGARRGGLRWSQFFGQVVKVDSSAEEETPRWPGRDGGSRRSSRLG